MTLLGNPIPEVSGKTCQKKARHLRDQQKKRTHSPITASQLWGLCFGGESGGQAASSCLETAKERENLKGCDSEAGLQSSSSSLAIHLLRSSSQKPLIQAVIFTLPRLDWWFQWFLHNNPWALVLISSLDVCFILQIVPWLVPGSLSIFCIFLLKRTAFAICHINPIIEPVPSHLTVMLKAILGSFVLFKKKLSVFFGWVSVLQCKQNPRICVCHMWADMLDESTVIYTYVLSSCEMKWLKVPIRHPLM